jgi:hypothetical protein
MKLTTHLFLSLMSRIVELTITQLIKIRDKFTFTFTISKIFNRIFVKFSLVLYVKWGFHQVSLQSLKCLMEYLLNSVWFLISSGVSTKSVMCEIYTRTSLL